MRIRIDSLSHIPIYKQISTQIRQLILSGQIQANEALPSSRSLGMELQVNMLTVQKAYKELRDEGLIYNKRGAGAFVSEDSKVSQASRVNEICSDFKALLTLARGYGMNHKELKDLFYEALKTEKDRAGPIAQN